jgi:hypothetical protein
MEMSKKQSDRELAELHWIYTEKIILKMLETMKTAYIESMVHGIKHGREENK